MCILDIAIDLYHFLKREKELRSLWYSRVDGPGFT